ncbi:MAG: germination protein YpeB [Clostridiales bacterium]|nr:germination protein YpeB [Clostridiales bacterium]
MREKGRNIFHIVLPVLLTVALVGVAFWGMQQSALAKEYKTTATAMYTRAFTELTDNINNLHTALGKLRVAASPSQYVLLLDDVWRLSGASVSLMAEVPSSHIDTAELNSFVVRLGDYAHTLTKKAVRGIPMTEEEQQQLDQLYETSGRIADELNGRLSIGDIPVAAITNDGYYTSAYGTEDAENTANAGNAGDDGYKEQEGIEGFPTLIYDGPFSESAEKQEPQGLSGRELSEEEAMEQAKRLTGLDALESYGTSDGAIPSYDFHGTYADGREVDVSVTKQGGQLLWMMSSAAGAAEGVPEKAETEKLKDAAEDFLERHGYDDMEATYAQYYSGAAVINFAAEQDDVILYSDLIKVWVDRETHAVIGADARNYCFSHRERQLPAPQLSMAEAESMLSSNLKVLSRELALIPITPQTEKLCYEFKGTCGEEEYIVYINVENGEEEQIFRILNNEDGELVV